MEALSIYEAHESFSIVRNDHNSWNCVHLSRRDPHSTPVSDESDSVEFDGTMVDGRERDGAIMEISVQYPEVKKLRDPRRYFLEAAEQRVDIVARSYENAVKSLEIITLYGHVRKYFKFTNTS